MEDASGAKEAGKPPSPKPDTEDAPQGSPTLASKHGKFVVK